jgi:hypothetical protein
MGQGKGFPAPLLPFWEQGLGAEGKPAQVAPTFAEWVAIGRRLKADDIKKVRAKGR